MINNDYPLTMCLYCDELNPKEDHTLTCTLKFKPKKFIENTNEWISVNKKLPSEDNWILYAVLVRDEKLYRHQIAFYGVSGKWFRETDQKNPIEVTHWVSLPSLPYL